MGNGKRERARTNEKCKSPKDSFGGKMQKAKGKEKRTRMIFSLEGFQQPLINDDSNGRW